MAGLTYAQGFHTGLLEAAKQLLRTAETYQQMATEERARAVAGGPGLFTQACYTQADIFHEQASICRSQAAIIGTITPNGK